jgi:hypothetical protein
LPELPSGPANVDGFSHIRLRDGPPLRPLISTYTQGIPDLNAGCSSFSSKLLLKSMMKFLDTLVYLYVAGVG